jgi:hypothetical protein
MGNIGLIVAIAVGAVVVVVGLVFWRARVRAGGRTGSSDDFAAERRKYVRLRREMPAYFQVLSSRPERPGTATEVNLGEGWNLCKLKDVSAGGVCVELEVSNQELWQEVLRGDVEPVFRVTFEKFDHRVEAKSRAVWGQVLKESVPLVVVAGFAFTAINDEEREAIGRYVRDSFYQSYQTKEEDRRVR